MFQNRLILATTIEGQPGKDQIWINPVLWGSAEQEIKSHFNLRSFYHILDSRGELGVRIKEMDKPLLCGKTAKDYKFWDNLMYHYKTLYPLYDKKVDFAQYTR